jgi:hypothetical protein
MRERSGGKKRPADECAQEDTSVAWAGHAAARRLQSGEEGQTSLTSDSQYRKIMTSATDTKIYYTINN